MVQRPQETENVIQGSLKHPRLNSLKEEEMQASEQPKTLPLDTTDASIPVGNVSVQDLKDESILKTDGESSGLMDSEEEVSTSGQAKSPLSNITNNSESIEKGLKQEVKDESVLKTDEDSVDLPDGEEMQVTEQTQSPPLGYADDLEPDEVPIKTDTSEATITVNAPEVAPTKKRSRTVFDGVLLPTLELVKRRKLEAEEDYKKLKLLKNPNVKKNEALALLPETIRYRLKPIGLEIQDQYFTVDQGVREVTVTRRFMSSVYGGNSQSTCPSIGKAFSEMHGMNDFMYLNTAFQPEAPEMAAAPGMFLNTESGSDFERLLRVFTKIRGSLWQYMGQYVVVAADPPELTVEEWRAQLPKFHIKWAQAISTKQWGTNVCIRIYSRRELHREPTEADYETIFKSGSYKTVTPEEIKAAYFSGQERMGVWVMKCVGYDNDFQFELSQRFPNWVPPPSKKTDKKQGKKAGKSSAAAPKTKASGQKRRRAMTPESETESEAESEEDGDTNMEVIDLSDD